MHKDVIETPHVAPRHPEKATVPVSSRIVIPSANGKLSLHPKSDYIYPAYASLPAYIRSGCESKIVHGHAAVLHSEISPHLDPT